MVARPLLAGSLALVAIAGCGGDASTTPTATPVASPPADATSTDAPPDEAIVPARGRIASGTVVYVSDGDTIGVRLDGRVQRVRLLGIDAPETKDPDREVACYGPEASARLVALVPRRMRVTVVTDPTQDERDRFGRLLAYVFRPRERVPVNQTMLTDGAARVYVYQRNHPFRRITSFRMAEASARADRRGLWGACPEAGP